MRLAKRGKLKPAEARVLNAGCAVLEKVLAGCDPNGRSPLDARALSRPGGVRLHRRARRVARVLLAE
jgi:hypothetical protein